ncbi:MAG: YesL family protein [Clostridia bacterium]|nr:YesL family protein [Clostridia bacterium]
MGLFSRWGERQLRAGKGVSKDAPKKKAFFVFFEILARKFWKLGTANLLYVACSLPVVTRGLSDVGLTFITRSYVREKHAFIASDFWDTIKKNWKQALPIGIINLLVTALIVLSLSIYGQQVSTNTLSMIGFGISMSVYIVFTVMKYYIPLLTITFRYNIRKIYKMAFYLTGLGWKPNLVVSGVLILCYAILFSILYFVSYNMLGVIMVILIYVLIFPAFRSFLIQFCIFPVIKQYIIDPYYAQHPDEDKDKRRDLGLEVEEDAVDEEEVIFVDRGETKPEEEQEVKANAGRSIPRQYSAEEMRRIRRHVEDDDDTI